LSFAALSRSNASRAICRPIVRTAASIRTRTSPLSLPFGVGGGVLPAVRSSSSSHCRPPPGKFRSRDRLGLETAAYYSLSATSFEKDELPPALAIRLPLYPLPAAILGRLAIDRTCQGQGLGETLLLDAFYERYGFRAFATEQRRLLPLESFEKLGL
jgi:hypothetical protein